MGDVAQEALLKRIAELEVALPDPDRLELLAILLELEGGKSPDKARVRVLQSRIPPDDLNRFAKDDLRTWAARIRAVQA